MSLTREDMLRELELLPAWQLRQPAQRTVVEPLPAIEAVESPVVAVEVAAPIVVEETPQAVPVPVEVISNLSSESAATETEGELLPQTIEFSPDRRAAIMKMDWNSLQHAVAECHACGLADTRMQTVFGVGDPNAEWLIIGEAPGAEEDRKGEPFVGQAGKLLDNMLAAIKLKRGENVFIANVLKCRPPQNRDPQGEEVVKCDPFLKRQVELIQPKLILALGKFAAQSILNSESTIASLRGKTHDFHGVPVIVTYHPAYLLRNLADKSKAWEDLCFAVATLQRLQSADIPQS